MGNSILIYGLATLCTSILGVSLRYCFKSKCEDVSLCFGLIKIHRDTQSEINLEQTENKSKLEKTESTNNLNNI